MRELKFRAWDIDSNKMRFDFYVNAPFSHQLLDHDDHLFGGEIMQYTGLKDKNGKEIYEGDIIKIPDDWESYGTMAGEVRQVYFKSGGFRLKPQEGKLKGCRVDEDITGCEIIGNIYENPDLIK